MKRTLLLTATALAIGAALTGLAIAHTAVPAEVGAIDGSPVTRDELVFHMERVRPTVENRLFVNRGSATIDWDAKQDDGRTALGILRTSALDEIAEDRVVFRLAAQHDLIGYTDFAGFERSLQATNESRRAQVERGEIVYGTTEFTAQEFYGRTLSELRTRLATALSAGEHPLISVSETDIAGYLDAHPGDWTANTARYSLTRLAIPATAAPAEEFARQATALGFDAFAAQTPSATLSADSFDGATGRFADASRTPNPQLAAELPTLAAGGVSAPVVENGDDVVYRIDAVAVDRDAALAEYGSRIRSLLEKDALDAEIARRVAGQDRQIDQSACEHVTMKDLN